MKFKRLTALLCSVLLAAAAIPPGTAAGAEEGTVIGINAVNAAPAEGHSVIYTPAYGRSIYTGGVDFAWWRTVTFEYSDEAEAYVVTDVSTSVGAGYPKHAYIPDGGFVLCANTGNDYSQSGGIDYTNELSTAAYNAIASLSPGDTAYVVGANIADGTIETQGSPYYGDSFVSDAKIYIGSRPENAEVYQPMRSEKVLETAVTDIGGTKLIDAGKDFVFSWAPVEGAEGYTVNINDCTATQSGTSIANNVRTSDTSYRISASSLTVGHKYSVSVSAYAEGCESSFNSHDTLSAVSESALDSPFAGKTIVAMGDSITAQTGWVSMLGGMLGTEVINSGVGGDNSSQGLARFDTDVIDKHPDIVFILFGMNDQAQIISTGKPIVDIADYESNYRAMIKKCLDAGAQPVLLTGHNVCTDPGYYTPGGYGLDYSTSNLQACYEVIRSLADELSLDLIDLNALCENEQASAICAAGDGIHLSSYGHQKYAEWISEYMLNEFEFRTPADESEESAPSDGSAGESSADNVTETSEKPAESTSDGASDGRNKAFAIGAIVVSALAAALVIARRISIAKNRKNQSKDKDGKK